MEYQLLIRHTAANEAGLANFMVFVRDNYGALVHQAVASSENLNCSATLVLAGLSECIAAVVAFKTQFTIKYELAIT